MKTKKILATAAAGLIVMASLAGCGSTGSSSSSDNSSASGFDTKSNISVITREDGSGTRSAFIELTGVQEEKNGTKTDNTLSSAIVQSSTQAVLT